MKKVNMYQKKNHGKRYASTKLHELVREKYPIEYQTMSPKEIRQAAYQMGVNPLLVLVPSGEFKELAFRKRRPTKRAVDSKKRGGFVQRFISIFSRRRKPFGVYVAAKHRIAFGVGVLAFLACFGVCLLAFVH